MPVTRRPKSSLDPSEPCVNPIAHRQAHSHLPACVLLLQSKLGGSSTALQGRPSLPVLPRSLPPSTLQARLTRGLCQRRHCPHQHQHRTRRAASPVAANAVCGISVSHPHDPIEARPAASRRVILPLVTQQRPFAPGEVILLCTVYSERQSYMYIR